MLSLHRRTNLKTRIRLLDYIFVSIALSDAVVSAGCLILYAGLGIIYGSYVGMQGHITEMHLVSVKMARALILATVLQLPLILLTWTLYTRLMGGEVAAATRLWRTVWTWIGVQTCAVGFTFVLGQLGFQPVVALVRWLDEVLAIGVQK
jgi:hypothetical protein